MKKYKVIGYIRVEAEDGELLSHEEALKDKEQAEFMQPENRYEIEEVEEE